MRILSGSSSREVCYKTASRWLVGFLLGFFFAPIAVFAQSLEQEGFAFGDDDGSESAHTLDTQDTNITEDNGTKTLRTLLNATDDPGNTAFQLKYQKNGEVSVSDVGLVLESGNNTASASWAVAHPEASAGDMLIFNIGWDDSTDTTTLTAPSGPNGESAVVIENVVASASTAVRGRIVYYIATGAWSAGTLAFTPSASEQWSAVVMKVPSGQFDASNPIGTHNNNPSTGTSDPLATPALTAGATDGGGQVISFFVVDLDDPDGSMTGWTQTIDTDRGDAGIGLFRRNAPATDNENIAEVTGLTTPSGRNWVSFAYIIRSPRYANVPVVQSMEDQKKAIPVGSELEFDTAQGLWNFLLRYDDTHSIHIWQGSGSDGFIQVFEVTSNGIVTPIGTALEFDTLDMLGASAVVFDTNKVLVQWAGNGSDGYIQTFQIDGSYTVTAWGSAVEYDTTNGTYPSIVAIDSNHFLCAWAGNGTDGYLQVAEVNLSTGVVTMQGSAYEHDTVNGVYNNLFVLDATHFLLVWSGNGGDGFARVFEVNTGTWAVTASASALEFDTGNATHINATMLDANHTLVAWADVDGDGRTQVLTINTSTWAVTAEGSSLEFEADAATFIAVQGIDEHNVFLQYEKSTASYGVWQTLFIDDSWSVSNGSPQTYFDVSAANAYNVLVKLTSSRVFALWMGAGSDGFCRAYDFSAHEIGITLSSNIASGGEATTARLTAPSGKTTGDFTTGRRWDDENGSDSIDIVEDEYTELEWVLTINGADTDDYFEFRVYDVDTALPTYTFTPKWTIGSGASIAISGTADGSVGATVKVAINGTPDASHTGTIQSGSPNTWTIANVAEPSVGDVVTVWIDNVGDSNEAVGITLYADVDVDGMVLNAQTLSLGSDDNQTITNAHISQYDNSASSNEDIFYDVDSNADLTACSASGSSGCVLSVLSGNTYRPDSGSSGNITVEDIDNAGTLTLDGNTLYVSGSFTSSGTFNADISTVDFNGSGSQTIPALQYYDLTSSSTGGRVLASSGTIGIAGIFTPGSNSYTVTGSTIDFNGANAQTVNASFTYNNLQVRPSANSVTTNFATGTVTVGGDLTIGNGTNTGIVVNANNASTTLTVTGSVVIASNTTFQANASNALTIGNDFTNNGTFTHNNGSVVLNTTTTASLNYASDTTFYDLSSTTAGKIIEFDESQRTTITHNFTITGTDCTTGRVFLKSVSNGNAWDLTVTGATVNVDYADIRDSNATGSPSADDSTQDNGGNTGWTIDGGACGGNTDPNVPASLTQKNMTDTNISESTWTTTNTPKLGFTITDPDGDTVKYTVQVATDSGFSGLVLDYTHGSLSASGTTFTFVVGTYGGGSCSGTCPTTLPDSATGYWWRVKAIDASSAESAYIEFGVSGTMDVKVDATAPTGGTIYDGTSGDQNWNDGSLTEISGNWTGYNGDVSGIAQYEYALRRQSDGYYWSVCSGSGVWQSGEQWCNNGTDTVFTQNSLNLATGTTYFVSVRATDNAGNVAIAIDSNGQQVLPLLSFSLSSNTVSFDNLNSTNGYTDTEFITTTTSTNASNGYTIKMYNTGNLSSPEGTVADFSGTWSSPAVWNPGTYGFGYTSNDTNVQGSNRFATATAFAGFAQAPPGDVIIDHTDSIDGSTGAVSNEQFTVTYKVAVSASQVASYYETSSIFIVTANF